MLTIILLQIGSFLGFSAETFYTRNLGFNAGIEYVTKTNKSHRLGYFRQEAIMNGFKNGTNTDVAYVRQGLYGDFCIGNLDNIAIFYVGGRLGTSNDNYVSFAPHATLAWRFNNNFEIPISWSTYNNFMVTSIGARIMFRGSNNTLYNSRRKAVLNPKNRHYAKR
jgi:hypothetical protein